MSESSPKYSVYVVGTRFRSIFQRTDLPHSPYNSATGPRGKHKAILRENIIETCEGQVIAGAAHSSQSCCVTPTFRSILLNISGFGRRPLSDRLVLTAPQSIVQPLLDHKEDRV
ncbi:hypothetical protein Y032_0403g833 [Ancylostoma ceylanicum]|uniref:Uncharacterized protein n=1 Tax=Ancylostoma ceylanicum TaxID=53326 RepID=A0A016X4U0_9BILA|nr:hypothetical protein Y032_0403g833 [Ancylostoma ceylanicum]